MIALDIAQLPLQLRAGLSLQRLRLTRINQLLGQVKFLPILLLQIDVLALQLGVLLVVVAVQMISLGLLGELMVNLRRRDRLDSSAEGDLR